MRRFCGILVTDYKIARTEFPYACAQAMSVNILYDSFLSDSLGYYKINPFNVLWEDFVEFWWLTIKYLVLNFLMHVPTCGVAMQGGVRGNAPTMISTTVLVKSWNQTDKAGGVKIWNNDKKRFFVIMIFLISDLVSECEKYSIL